MNLKPVEIGVLALSLKENEWTGEDQKIAHRLVKRGYLTSDLAKPSLFRATVDGENLLRKLLEPTR